MKKSNQLPNLLDSLEKYYQLQEHGINWRDGERTLHEMWRMYPPRSFNSYSITSLYHFACSFLTKDRTIIDFGCGTGYGSYLLAARTKAKKVIGVDLDEASISWGRKRYKRANLHLNCINLFNQELDCYLGKTDFVYCSNVMEHIENYTEVLERIYNFLKPGGIYFHVTPPSGEPGGNKYHITNFKIPEWRIILEKIGFLNQRYFAHQHDLDREFVMSEFDFSFIECGPYDMTPSSGLGSISGIILALKPFKKK